MIATARSNPSRQIRRSELEQFRQSIESWDRQGQEAGRDGDVELATGYAEDVADLRAILRLIENGALREAAEAIHCLDTLVRDQIPQRLYDAVVPCSRRLGCPSATDPLVATSDWLRSPRLERGPDSGAIRGGGSG